MNTWSGSILSAEEDACLVSHYITKSVPFRFRGLDFCFDLSQGLFSSAGVDAGTSLLLKVFSSRLDHLIESGEPLPCRILDAGCGCGIIGICAAAAISALHGCQVHAQDRDELARLMTLHNAAKNNIPASVLEAYTEPLLAVPETPGWDLILTNIPAKAGTPVLEDFVSRSLRLLNPGGSVIMVAVQALADFFREKIAAATDLVSRTDGSGYSVFAYSRKKDATEAALPPAANNHSSEFLARYPFYFRTRAEAVIEDLPVCIETVYGASGFDSPGAAVLAAAKLLSSRIGTVQAPVLIHEPAQGFFPCWLIEYCRSKNAMLPQIILSGRNILALDAARHNVIAHNGNECTMVPAADLRLGSARLLEKACGNKFGCVAAFPELLPQSALPKETDQLASLWNSLVSLLAPGGIVIAAFGSSDAERFDRKKPSGFTRLGSVKKNGFRALGYEKS